VFVVLVRSYVCLGHAQDNGRLCVWINGAHVLMVCVVALARGECRMW